MKLIRGFRELYITKVTFLILMKFNNAERLPATPEKEIEAKSGKKIVSNQNAKQLKNPDHSEKENPAA